MRQQMKPVVSQQFTVSNQLTRLGWCLAVCGLLLTLLQVVPVWAGEISFQAWTYNMPGEQQFYHDLIADFEQANPGDTVNCQLAGWEGAHDKLATWLKNGTGPDLMVVCDTWLAEFAPYLVPYVDEMSSAQKAEFYDVLLNKATYQGHTYGLVWATSTKALFVRPDLLHKSGTETPPADWDELLQAARRLRRVEAPWAVGIPAALTYGSTDNWYFFFWSAGGEFFDEHGKAAVNSPLGVAALEFYADLARRSHVTQPEVTAWSRKDLEMLFAQGLLAMHADGPWLLGTLKATDPKLQYTVVPLPLAPNRPPFHPRRVTQVITDHLVLAQASPNKDLARRFIQFAYQDRYRQQFCQLGLVPEKKAVGATDFFQTDPNWKAFVDLVPDGKFLPLMNWEPIELATQQMLWKVFSGRMKAQVALNELAAKMNEIAASEQQAVR